MVIIEMNLVITKYFNAKKRRRKTIKFLCSDNITVRNALVGLSIIELRSDQRSRLYTLSLKYDLHFEHTVLKKGFSKLQFGQATEFFIKQS